MKRRMSNRRDSTVFVPFGRPGVPVLSDGGGASNVKVVDNVRGWMIQSIFTRSFSTYILRFPPGTLPIKMHNN